MKIQIDFSLMYGSTNAYGRVYGELDLPSIPQIGNVISFTFPNNKTLPVIVSGFDGNMNVVGVRFAPQALKTVITLSLDDVILETLEDAQKVMKYLEDGFGLFGDSY